MVRLASFRRSDEALFIEMLKLGRDGGSDNGWKAQPFLGLAHTIGGGPARTSRLPAWLAGLTTPSCSIRSIREAARL